MFSIFKPRLFFFAGLAGAAVGVAAPAFAETETDTLSIQVTVQEQCTVSGGTLDFGTYTAGQTEPLTAQGQISYDGCAEGTLVFSLDGGQTGNVTARAMQNGDKSVAYQLYRNSARTQIWGTDSDAMEIQLLEAGNGTVPVYGTIPAGQNASPGSYSDAVNVTLTF